MSEPKERAESLIHGGDAHLTKELLRQQYRSVCRALVAENERLRAFVREIADHPALPINITSDAEEVLGE